MRPLLLFSFVGVAISKLGLWAWLSGNEDVAMSQIRSNKDIITDISYGNGFSLDCGDATIDACSLKTAFNATKDASLAKLGVRRWPLIGCGSTPSLRKLFSNPDAFISAAVSEAEKYGFEGYNLDFEPYDKLSTNDDGAAYGTFLNTFAKALHAATPPKLLSLDYFSNNGIWNLPAMNSSAVDLMISMDTYVKDNKTFEAYYQV